MANFPGSSSKRENATRGVDGIPLDAAFPSIAAASRDAPGSDACLEGQPGGKFRPTMKSRKHTCKVDLTEVLET